MPTARAGGRQARNDPGRRNSQRRQAFSASRRASSSCSSSAVSSIRQAAPQLIELIDAKRRPSEIADDIGIANFRTSETCDLDWRDPAVAAVDRKIWTCWGCRWRRASRSRASAMRRVRSSSLTPIRSSRAATTSSVHTAERRPAHLDRDDLSQRARGRRRTRFKTIGKTVQPETGKLLAWNTCCPMAAPIPRPCTRA